MHKLLRKPLVVVVLTLAAASVEQSAFASPGHVLRWESLIGIAQGNSIVGTGTGAVTGAPGPWSALGGHVKVDLEKGEIDFDTRGLVLASGNSIGTPGAVVQVKGTLVCDADG